MYMYIYTNGLIRLTSWMSCRIVFCSALSSDSAKSMYTPTQPHRHVLYVWTYICIPIYLSICICVHAWLRSPVGWVAESSFVQNFRRAVLKLFTRPHSHIDTYCMYEPIYVYISIYLYVYVSMHHYAHRLDQLSNRLLFSAFVGGCQHYLHAHTAT